jgi:hypothetical protein
MRYAQLLGGIVLAAAAMAPAHADVLFQFSQSGGNVVMNSSGVLDTSKLVAATVSGWGNAGVETNGGGESDIMGDTTMGLTDLGYGFHAGTDLSAWIGNMFTFSNFDWVSAGTTQFSTYFSNSGFRTPGIQLSREDLSGALWTPDVSWTKVGTFASLGLTEGTYTITDAVTQESITIQIGGSGQAEVPEPVSLALFGLGLGGVAFARRRRIA